MNVYNSDSVISSANTAVASEDVKPDIPFFKTERGYNINITAIARKAQQEGIDAVRTIAVPARVRKQKRRNETCDTPSLSEIGGGEECEYCQVIAGSDGRPVNIDNVLFVNNDPETIGANHGSAAVSRDTIFSLGWKRHADRVILIYRIVETCELVMADMPVSSRGSSTPNDQPIAKLTCELIGHSLDTWRGQQSFDIANTLSALYRATETRLTTDWHAPMYMDIFRIRQDMRDTAKSSNDVSARIAADMRQGLFGPVIDCEPDRFMIEVMTEIFDVRTSQYTKLPSGAERRAGMLNPYVEQVRAVEIIELDRANDTITVELVIPRTEDALPQHFRTTLTVDNYTDGTGRLTLERGLVLRQPTFERLRAELDRYPTASVVVNLTSLR